MQLLPRRRAVLPPRLHRPAAPELTAAGLHSVLWFLPFRRCSAGVDLGAAWAMPVTQLSPLRVFMRGAGVQRPGQRAGALSTVARARGAALRVRAAGGVSSGDVGCLHIDRAGPTDVADRGDVRS